MMNLIARVTLPQMLVSIVAIVAAVVGIVASTGDITPKIAQESQYELDGRPSVGEEILGEDRVNELTQETVDYLTTPVDCAVAVATDGVVVSTAVVCE